MCPENCTLRLTYFLLLNKFKVDLSPLTHSLRIITHFLTHFFQCWRGFLRIYAFFFPYVGTREKYK